LSHAALLCSLGEKLDTVVPLVGEATGAGEIVVAHLATFSLAILALAFSISDAI